MSLTVRENVAVRLCELIEQVSGLTALRPKRLHWADDVTGDVSGGAMTITVTYAVALADFTTKGGT